jgi:hypothetical protein
VDNSPLGQVDIKNSQPLFFYLVIKDVKSIPEKEKEEYRKLVEEGRFYEFFMERFKIKPELRDEYKQKILTGLFFDKNRGKPNRYLKYFTTQFPSIVAYIAHIKKDDYRDLIRLLQRTESNFIIEQAVARFI